MPLKEPTLIAVICHRCEKGRFTEAQSINVFHFDILGHIMSSDRGDCKNTKTNHQVIDNPAFYLFEFYVRLVSKSMKFISLYEDDIYS